jgi:transcriptional regulator with XRE-family HTH domain
MERLWIPAIRRLMAANNWNQQELSHASGVRPNTISDALNPDDPSNPRIETFVALAAGFKVPLWALFCTAHEHALFTEQTKRDDAATTAATQREALRSLVQAELEPLTEAILAKLTGQSPAPPAKPLPVRPTLAPAHKSAQKKRRHA